MFIVFDENVDINEERFNVTRTVDLRAAAWRGQDARFETCCLHHD